MQKAAGQITQVADALSGLASLHGAGRRIDRTNVSIGKLLTEVAGSPELKGVAPLDIRVDGDDDEVVGVFRLLRQALAGLARSVAWDLLKETDRPLSIWAVNRRVESERWIVIAATDHIPEAAKTPHQRLLPFDNHPNRFSMDLPFASEVVGAHGGQLLALPEGTPGAVVVLPTAAK